MRHFCITLLAALVCLTLAACMAGLPSSLRQRIATEKQYLQQARQQYDHDAAKLNTDLAEISVLLQGVSQPQEWHARLQADASKLKQAETDQQKLDDIARRKRADTRTQAEKLLAEETALRRAAVEDAQSVVSTAERWVQFAHYPSAYVAQMAAEYDAICNADLTQIQKTIAQAEQDWPAKKDALELRLATLITTQKNAEREWEESAAERANVSHGKLTGALLVALLHEDQDLQNAANALPHEIEHLHDDCNQLYTAWDRILTDLDIEHDHGRKIFREQIETIRTTFAPGTKKSETSSDKQWLEVSESQFHAIENDLGMAIAHKDAGKFDSEATNTPEPAGFAYIAQPSQGSNQYGYWTHEGGQSFWTFFPEYLLLRELMWGHDYRPIVLDEYRSYRTAETAGRTWYGTETPTSPPKYGTHGTFTRTRYANSRYMQSGGFRGSAYASRRFGSSGFQESHQPYSFSGNGAGKRFGRSPGYSPGKRFGGGLGRGFGRGFGRR
jgi:hypothetical protein